MHVIERWKLSADGNRVDVSVTVDDPGAFVRSAGGACSIGRCLKHHRPLLLSLGQGALVVLLT